MLETIDPQDKALRIFERLLELFEEHEVNPAPLNYYVWYEYIKGDIPQLRNEMDSILNDPFGYNDRVGKRLYDTYLVQDESAMTDFDRAFRRLIEVMIKKMDVWSEKLEQQTKQLDECSSRLSNPDLNSDEIKQITTTVRDTASSMKASSQAFQEEMLSNTNAVKELKQQLMEARAEALKDELTEVGNRKAFNNALEELMFDAEQKPESLCLILSDIDHFKQFNDTYGHLVGDSVLRYYANIMKKNQRNNETICRYGGEEFAILLSQSSLEQAIARAEEIRQDIAAALLKRKNSSEPLKTITASFGIAYYKGSANDDEKRFIERADKALYKAKESGRNNVKTENDLD